MIFRKIIDLNIRASDALDRLIFDEKSSFLIDGNTDVSFVVSDFVTPGMVVIDIGGGKRPFFDVALKDKLNLFVRGIDISEAELALSPQGAYDETVVTAIEDHEGSADADLCVCIAVLEHVRNVELALKAIASCLKPKGHAVLFIPSRNALFARLNLWLPQNIKKKLLYSVFPEKKKDSGFESFYDRCTPQDIENLCSATGMSIVRELLYHNSGYFRCFFPIHLIWRGWVYCFKKLARRQSAETFTIVLSRNE